MSKLELDHKLIREVFKNDPEFYVEVKQAILKSAIQHDAGRLMDQLSRDYLQQIIKEEITSYVAEPGKVVTSIPTKRMREHVKLVISDDIRNMINEEFKEREEFFKEFVSRIINANAAKLIDTEVNRRLRLAIASLGVETHPDITQSS